MAKEIWGWLSHPSAWLSAAWLLAIALVNPQGDFPLNDDWAYGRNVYHLVQEGRLQFSDWPAMTLIAQVLWGAAWAEAFGFSFTVLRWSSLALGGAGLLAFYAALREMGADRRLAVGSALLLGFNPLYFSLSFTFMTDVPFLALFLLSILYFLKAWNSRRLRHITLGTVFAIAATLIRQFGLLPPLAFGLAWLGRERSLRALLPAFLPLLGCWLALKGYQAWLAQLQGLPPHFGQVESIFGNLFSEAFWKNLLWRPGAFLFYWGFFLLPFSLWMGPPRPRQKTEWTMLAIAASLTVMAAIPAWPLLPTGNIWTGLRLGPPVLKDAYFGENLYPVMSPEAWCILKIIGFAGGGLLLWQGMVWVSGFRFWRTVKHPPKAAIPALALLAYLFYLLLSYYFFDRYHILSLPLLMLVLTGLPASPLRFPRMAGLLLFLMAAFSITATHDYLAWNRARWQLLEHLINQKGISPAEIDGGFEFNGWYDTGPRNPIRRYGKGWWFVDEDAYAVSFGPLDCYEPYRAAPFPRWLPPGRDSVWVYQRQPAASADTLFCDAERLSADGKYLISSRPSLKMGNAACRDSSRALSGKYAVRLKPGCAYGFTTWLEGVGPCTTLKVSAWRYGGGSSAGIVLSAPDAGDFHQMESHHVVDRKDGWEQLELELTLPEHYPAEKVVVYIWNPGEEVVWFDDFRANISPALLLPLNKNKDESTRNTIQGAYEMFEGDQPIDEAVDDLE